MKTLFVWNGVILYVWPPLRATKRGLIYRIYMHRIRCIYLLNILLFTDVIMTVCTEYVRRLLSLNVTVRLDGQEWSAIQTVDVTIIAHALQVQIKVIIKLMK